MGIILSRNYTGLDVLCGGGSVLKVELDEDSGHKREESG